MLTVDTNTIAEPLKRSCDRPGLGSAENFIITALRGLTISAASERKSRSPSATVVRKRFTLGDNTMARSHGLATRAPSLITVIEEALAVMTADAT